MTNLSVLHSPLVFEIPGEPIVKKNSRKIRAGRVSRKTGRRTLYPGKSDKLKDAEHTVALLFASQKNKLLKHGKFSDLKLPITGPIAVKFTFYCTRDKDLSNMYEFPQDMLETAGIIENDSQIQSHDGSRKWKAEGNPRTKIEIIGLNPETYA